MGHRAVKVFWSVIALRAFSVGQGKVEVVEFCSGTPCKSLVLLEAVEAPKRFFVTVMTSEAFGAGLL